MPPRDSVSPMSEHKPPAVARADAFVAGHARLRLLGDPAVIGADGAVRALERRAAGLLALVALEPGITRARAAALLWPDSDNARRALRQQLSRFRKIYGAELATGEDALFIANGIAVDALDSSNGALLGELSFDDCEEFDAWLSTQRARRRGGELTEIAQLLAEAEAQGDLAAAVRFAQQLVAVDAASEEHHRTLMRLHYLRGDIGQAQATYDRLAAQLAREFQARPSAETEQLAQALRSAREALPAAVAAPVRSLPVTVLRPPLLAGRQSERTAAVLHWAEGRAVLLEGEAGLGKSRLMADLLEGANAVLVSAGRPGDSGAPYSTLERLLRPVLGDGPEGLDASTCDALAHIVPMAAFGAATHARPAADGADASADRPPPAALRPGAMARAVSELLRQRHVQVVALDDLHFADEATLDLLAGLAAQNDPPRRWLFAVRPAELSAAAQALRGSLTELQRLGVVPLAALDEGAIATIVDSLAIQGLRGAALAAALLRHTGGNPLFVLETLKRGLSDGSLARGELPHPQSVGSLIERRLQRLGESALTLARIAAIAGVDFSIELAESAIGVRAVQLASAWNELQDAQIVRDESFAHDLVCDAVLRSVPPVVARRVHAQCAQWLAARGAEPARVAWHWRLGGMPAEAGRAFVAAAVRAEMAARLEEEAALYQHAAQAFAEADLHEERFSALVGRVRSLSQAEFGDMATQECRALIAAAGTDAQRVRAHSELAGLLTERGEPLAALEAGGAAMALARRLGDHEWQVRTACHMASSHCRLGHADEAVALLAPLRSWVDAQPDDTLRMLWHGDWGAALGQTGRLREAVAAFDVALGAARRLGLRDSEGRLLLNCSVALRQSGQYDRALAFSRQGQALSAAEIDDAAAPPIDRLVLARDESETGFYNSALPALESVVTEFGRRGAGFWLQASRMVLVRLWLDLGQYARAVPLLRDEPDDLPAWLRADRRLLQLELASALDQAAPAAVLDEALALAPVDPQRGPGMQVRALRALPPAQVLAQAPDLARTLAARERFGGLLALHVQVARAALDKGQTDLAASSARAALALFEEGYAPESMYRPEANLVAWRALAQAGAHAEAAAALDAGIEWIRSHALPHVPVTFIDSFLHRNPVNRELLAAAKRAAALTESQSSAQSTVAALAPSKPVARG